MTGGVGGRGQRGGRNWGLGMYVGVAVKGADNERGSHAHGEAAPNELTGYGDRKSCRRWANASRRSRSRVEGYSPDTAEAPLKSRVVLLYRRYSLRLNTSCHRGKSFGKKKNHRNVFFFLPLGRGRFPRKK